MRLKVLSFILCFISTQAFAVEYIEKEISEDDSETIEVVQACVSPNTIGVPVICRPGVAESLGWTIVEDNSSMCGGYYTEPYLPFVQRESGLKDKDDLLINAGGEASLYQGGKSTLGGGVTLEQPGKQVSADVAHIYRDAQTGKITKVELVDRVTIREQGRLILGERGEYYPVEERGSIVNVFYRMAMSEKGSNEGAVRQINGLSVWGRANKITRETSGNYELEQVTYSTCPPVNNDWQIQANHIYLDKDKGRGYAKKVVLKVKDVPVFYLPYFSFPIDDRRESGFLTPTMGYSNRTGATITVPYYLNLAPNYDATLQGRYYSLRGVMGAAQFRYLTPSSIGTAEGTFLPNDRAYKKFINPNVNKPILDGSYNRSSFFWNHLTRVNNYLQAHAVYSYVSDPYYFQDFRSNVTAVTRNQLLREAGLTYTDRHWFFSTKFQAFQTLHPINLPPINNVYSRLPNVILRANYPQVIKGMDVKLNSQLDYFVWPWQGNDALRQRTIDDFRLRTAEALRGLRTPDALRTHLNPVISFPYRSAPGFFVPTIQMMQTNYSLSGDAFRGNFRDLYRGLSGDEFRERFRDLYRDVSRTVPLINVDAGLVFERNISLWGNDLQQTLEPRLFYLYVPYVDQRHIKVFDSAYIIFNYEQLFRTNRFSGIDRVGDAHQVSAALTSRFLDSNTGIERARISVGQIYYFADRRVQLCDISIDCKDAAVQQVGFVSPTARVSPIVAQLRYNLTGTLTFTSDVAWEPKTRQMNNANFDLKYQPKPDSVINLGYTFLTNGDLEGRTPGQPIVPLAKKINLSQIYISGAFPLVQNWHVLGAWRYNINNQFAMSYYAGLEYESCCWAIRLLGGQTAIAIGQGNVPGQVNRGVFLQFLFKGMGTVGVNDASSIVRTQMRGYRDIFI